MTTSPIRAVKQRAFILLCLLLSIAVWAKAQNRSWQTGTLNKTDYMKVREGNTETATMSGYLNANRNSFSPANIPSTTITPDFETYQEFTIEGGQEIYVVRQHLSHSCSKPALRTVGEHVRFAVEQNVLYLIGEDGKQHKTIMVKVKPKVPVDQNRQPGIPS
jgi:hypothetical protein